MHKIAGFLAALLLGGSVVTAASAPPAPASAAPAACSAKEFVWQKLGGDPFATSEAEAMRKHATALRHAVKLGCMPQEVADALEKLVRENPMGTPVTIVPDARLAFMESGKKPILNVRVGRNVVSAKSGLVVAITARAWSVRDVKTGIVYQWMMPYVCFNWSLMILPPSAPPQPAAPPRAEANCAVSNRWVNVRTDAAVHIVGLRIDPNDPCTAWRYQGEHAWRKVSGCDRDCYYSEQFWAVARSKVGNANSTFTMRVPVIADGVIQVRVPEKALERSSGMALIDCLELRDGTMSDSVYTRSDDYRYFPQHSNQFIATIFRTQAHVPADWKARKLYFRFSAR